MELSWPFLATMSFSFSIVLGFVLIWVSVSKHSSPDYRHVAASVFVNMLKGSHVSGDSWASRGSVEHNKKRKEQDISSMVSNSCRGLRGAQKKNGSREQISSGPVRLQLNWFPKGFFFFFFYLSTNMQVCFSFELCLSHVLGATLTCPLPLQCLESGTASAEKSTTLPKR